ncbi:MAG: hypothetical protein AMXMBFR64_40470 [Myxococcales bacterium]
MKCAICKQPVPPRPQNKSFPFCCERCRMTDLGRWLAEDYTISEPLWMDPEAADSGAGLEQVDRRDDDENLH